MHNRQDIKWREDLERCTRLYEGFAEAAPFVKAVYECVDGFGEDHPITPQPAVDPKEAADRLRTGMSLEVNPALDTKDVAELLIRISEASVEANPELEATMKVLKENLEQFVLNSPAEVSKEDIWRLCDLLIKETELEQDLATFLFSITLSSFFRQHTQSTVEVLRTDLWQEGNCPLCGEMPHYGMLRPEDGAKEMECWLCGTKWVHSRIKCPFCGNEEQESLGYFTVENREICRINFCQQCRQYSKIINARKFNASGGIILSIHNLASLSHDLLARQEGFTPGSGLEWVNSGEVTDRREVVEKW